MTEGRDIEREGETINDLALKERTFDVRILFIVFLLYEKDVNSAIAFCLHLDHSILRKILSRTTLFLPGGMSTANLADLTLASAIGVMKNKYRKQ